jgi:hypothetical protein
LLILQNYLSCHWQNIWHFETVSQLFQPQLEPWLTIVSANNPIHCLKSSFLASLWYSHFLAIGWGTWPTSMSNLESFSPLLDILNAFVDVYGVTDKTYYWNHPESQVSLEFLFTMSVHWCILEVNVWFCLNQIVCSYCTNYGPWDWGWGNVMQWVVEGVCYHRNIVDCWL